VLLFLLRELLESWSCVSGVYEVIRKQRDEQRWKETKEKCKVNSIKFACLLARVFGQRQRDCRMMRKPCLKGWENQPSTPYPLTYFKELTDDVWICYIWRRKASSPVAPATCPHPSSLREYKYVGHSGSHTFRTVVSLMGKFHYTSQRSIFNWKIREVIEMATSSLVTSQPWCSLTPGGPQSFSHLRPHSPFLSTRGPQDCRTVCWNDMAVH
jgi:hypothetical protein